MAAFRIVEILYPGLTQLDFTGPHTVFTRLPDTEVIVASRDGGEIASDGGLTFAHVARLADIDRCDLICLPGGFSATEAANDAVLIAEIRRLAAGARYLTSVCTGSLILGAILTQYLEAHHEEILEMHAQVQSQRALAATAELCASVGVPLPEAALTTRASAALFDPATKNTRGARFPSPPRR